MLYFAIRVFGFLVTNFPTGFRIPGYKHKHKNLLFSLTPLVLHSFSPLPYSFIHLPAVFAPYFSHFLLFLSLISPHVFDLLTVLASPPAPSLSLLLPSHSCSLSHRLHLCNPLSFSSIIFILFIQSAFSNCPFSSLPLISSLTVANSFLSSPFSSLTAANSFLSVLISSLISLIMVVFISLL
jgi:hypothetical protein